MHAHTPMQQRAVLVTMPFTLKRVVVVPLRSCNIGKGSIETPRHWECPQRHSCQEHVAVQ